MSENERESSSNGESRLLEMVAREEVDGSKLLPPGVPRSTYSRRSASDVVCSHVSLLFKKNILVMKRNYKTTLVQILSPIVACLILCFWQNVASQLSGIIQIENEITPFGDVSTCIADDDFNPFSDSSFVSDNGSSFFPPCLTVGYAIIGERQPWIDHALNFLAADNHLSRKKEIHELSITRPSDFNIFL